MIAPKFQLDQEVFAVTTTYDIDYKNVHCDLCDSTGKISVSGKQGEYVCPACNGRVESVHNGLRYKILKYGATVGKIEVTMYSSRNQSYHHRSGVCYMLNETGVGSGQVWREDRLFATQEEAEEFCAKYVPESINSDSRAIPKGE